MLTITTVTVSSTDSPTPSARAWSSSASARLRPRDTSTPRHGTSMAHPSPSSGVRTRPTTRPDLGLCSATVRSGRPNPRCSDSQAENASSILVARSLECSQFRAPASWICCPSPDGPGPCGWASPTWASTSPPLGSSSGTSSGGTPATTRPPRSRPASWCSRRWLSPYSFEQGGQKGADNTDRNPPVGGVHRGVRAG
jgi:hypothetical protein